MWEIEGTDQFADWYSALDLDDQKVVEAAVDALQERGPALGRPWVDQIKASRHQNMKDYARVAQVSASCSPLTPGAMPSC